MMHLHNFSQFPEPQNSTVIEKVQRQCSNKNQSDLDSLSPVSSTFLTQKLISKSCNYVPLPHPEWYRSPMHCVAAYGCSPPPDPSLVISDIGQPKSTRGGTPYLKVGFNTDQDLHIKSTRIMTRMYPSHCRPINSRSVFRIAAPKYVRKIP